MWSVVYIPTILSFQKWPHSCGLKLSQVLRNIRQKNAIKLSDTCGKRCREWVHTGRSKELLLSAHYYFTWVEKKTCCQIQFNFLIFSVSLVSQTHCCCCPASALSRTTNYPPATLFTGNGTIKTLSLNNLFTGHWGLMTVGVKEQMNPLEQNSFLAV